MSVERCGRCGGVGGGQRAVLKLVAACSTSEHVSRQTFMLLMPCAKHEWRQNGARTVRGVHAQRTRTMLRPISYHLILY